MVALRDLNLTRTADADGKTRGEAFEIGARKGAHFFLAGAAFRRSWEIKGTPGNGKPRISAK